MSRGAWSGEIGKLQHYRTLRFWGGGSAYVVWEGGGWSVILFLIITGHVRVCDWLFGSPILALRVKRGDLRCAARRFMLACWRTCGYFNIFQT